MDYDFLDEPLRIIAAQDIHLINALLHDESAEIDDMNFDCEKRVLNIPVRRQIHSSDEVLIQSSKGSSVFAAYWTETNVIVRHVESYELQKDQGLMCYTFNNWAYSKNLLTIVFNESLVINIKVENLDIKIQDIGSRWQSTIVLNTKTNLESL